MAKFIMANRRAGKFQETEKRASRASLDMAFAERLEESVTVLGDTRPDNDQDRRIIKFEASAEEVANKIKELPPDVIIEPEILHYPLAGPRFHSTWLPFVAGAQPLDAGAGMSLRVHVTGSGNDIAGATLTLYLRGALGRSIKKTLITPASGTVSFDYNAFWSPTALVILPAGNFWSYVVRGPVDPVAIELPPLPTEGELGWWHRALGISSFDSDLGRPIRVGVIDSGCGPHPYLSHVTDAGAFLDGVEHPNQGADVDSHGTHVCGTIGARPDPGSNNYGGIAPGVDLICARVFPPDRGADQGDISNAIDALSKTHQVDLINMSVGADQGSEIARDAIIDALERGTLCICAAGNSAGPVEYPAAFAETVAVAAIGLEGWGPEGTLTAGRYPQETEKYGNDNFYLSNFSCFGDTIDCCAPGVGIIATVPERHGLTEPSGVMDGTSMASPVVCGALAAILAADQAYLSMPRNVARSEQARAILRARCRDLRLAARYQGRGIPQVF